MRIRAGLVLLCLLMLILCTASRSEAAAKYKYNIRDLTCPEHPWQHDDSPGDQDSLSHNPAGAVILPLVPGIKAILFIPKAIGIKGDGKKALGINRPEANDRRSAGGR